jgi:hypothetical protein
MNIIIVNKQNKTAIIKEDGTYSVVHKKLKKTGLTLDSARSIYYGLQKKLINKEL